MTQGDVGLRPVSPSALKNGGDKSPSRSTPPVKTAPVGATRDKVHIKGSLAMIKGDKLPHIKGKLVMIRGDKIPPPRGGG